MSSNFDTLVLGDGVAAWAVSIFLARAGATVALVGRSGKSVGPSIGEYLPPEGVLAAHAVKIGDLLDSPAHRSSAGIVSLWGSDHPVASSVLDSPGGQAYCLDRRQLHADLSARGREFGVRQVVGTGGPRQHETSWSINTTAGPISAGLLIDASGRAAAGARAAGAKVRRTDQLVAVARVFTDKPCPDSRLVVASNSDGWAYVAPLTHDRQVAVVLTDADCLPRGHEARAEFALARLSASSEVSHRLGNIPPGPFFGLAAWSQITEPSAGSNWVAIGDAAMGFDPIGSAGLTKALRDAKEVSQSLQQGQRGDLRSLLSTRSARFDSYQFGLVEAYATERRHTSPFWARRREIDVWNGVA